MSEQDKRNTMQLELTCFIWSELELREQRWPVYNRCGIGAYEVLQAVQEIAEHYRPVAAGSHFDWLDILYVQCAKIADDMHSFISKHSRMPTWSELGIKS